VTRGFFPLDRQLKLTTHSWTPETLSAVIGLAVEVPAFERAAACIQQLTHMPISKSSLQRLVGEYGGRLVAAQVVEAEAMVKPPAKFDEEDFRQVAPPDSEVMAVSMDGAMINVRGEGWKEVKTAAIAAVVPRPPTAGDGPEAPLVQLIKLSYRSGLWEAASFADQQWAEASRRGVEKAKRVVCVNDGARWIWLIVDRCYQPCVEILDWWHAVEKLWLIGRLLWGEKSELVGPWVAEQKNRLWAGRLRLIFRDIHTRYRRGPLVPEGLTQALGYLFSHRHRMRYAEFRRLGYPIGSGAVESACKTVAQARLKQAGMRWSRSGAQAMLALRSIVLSDRWDQIWPTIAAPAKVA
jgi:hypothetical protein